MRRGGANAMTRSLHALQRAMRDALHEREPRALSTRLAAPRRAMAVGSWTAEDGLSVYVEMYWGRLVMALADDFPVVVTMLGRPLFERVAVTHLKRHPSSAPSIAFIGRKLEDTLEYLGFGEEAAVARFEWARNAAFWSPDRAAVTATALGALGEALGEARLTLAPSLQLVTIPEAALLRVEAHGKALEGQPAPTDGTCAVAVWRQGGTIVHARLEADEASALERARGGDTVASCCEAFANADSPADESVGAIVRWVSRGWIVAFAP